jgi:hypothetical protein
MTVLKAVLTGQTPGPDPAVAAVKSYRYLRLAMVGMVLGLGVAVAREAVRVGDCLQTSLSGYYYTPVQNFFVGALVTIGVCLVALKGNTDWEDVLLNFAGICAPFVALVPTPHTGDCGTTTGTFNRDLNVDNNVFALLVVIGAVLVLLPVLMWRSRADRPHDAPPTKVEILGYAESVLLYLAAVAVFWLQRDWFDEYGHPVAAIAMFVFIFANVVVNAFNIYYQRRDTADPVRKMNRYAWIALAMVVCALGNWGLKKAGFGHWVLTIEASLITCFAVFWVFQTWELWDQGLRTEEVDASDREPDPGPAATPMIRTA